ncbi:MAG: histidine phosphatase family protein [Candidatus Vogelbacteria bacterium]|nr:histidine phosphatase family protein [Candidatus Vogelbacteria bacterium]
MKDGRLILVRHGESVRNKSKTGGPFFRDSNEREPHLGIPDHKVPLTDLGYLQAERAGKWLREMFAPPSVVWHSGYARTLGTMARALEAVNYEMYF